MTRQVFTTSGTFTPPAGVTSIDVLIVGGGGAGGNAGSTGGGGGGGEVRWETGVSVTPSVPVTITVGSGGPAASGTAVGPSGSQSAFGMLTAAGGGGGGAGASIAGGNGASGGGAAASNGATGSAGTGSPGGNGGTAVATASSQQTGGGGGGAGGAGANAAAQVGGNGGPGIDHSTQVGSDVGDSGWFGGGGGGGKRYSDTGGDAGAGGNGGGGRGCLGSLTAGTATTQAAPGNPATGGGGGGAGNGNSGTTVGRAGGSGVVIVVYDGPPEPPTITASNLTAPTGRWQGKATYLSWWDGYRWGGVLPTDVGHVIYPDLTDLETAGTVVDSRQSSRVTTVLANGVLYALRGHATSSLLSSYDADDDYAPLVVDAAVPLTSPNLDAAPITLHRSPNGYLWAATMTNSQVRVSRSTDDGDTWGSAETIATIGSSATGIVALTTTGSTVVLVAVGNDGAGRAVRTIGQGSGSYISGSWTSETLPALPSGATSDDHLSVETLGDGTVLATSKTTNDNSNIMLIYGMIRDLTGSWTQHSIVTGPDDTDGYTRPALAVEPAAIRVVYGQHTSPERLYGRETTMSTLPTWSSQSTLLATGDRADSAATPRTADIAAAAPEDYPLLSHNCDSGAIDLLWLTPETSEGGSSAMILVAGDGAGRKTAGGPAAAQVHVSADGAGIRSDP